MSEFESCMNCKHVTKKETDFPCNECKHGVNVKDHYKPRSNADHIRSMSDEELADFLEEFAVCTHCKYNDEDRCTFENPCSHGFAGAIAYEWLKSEAKE